jgi:large subunit ribosomal protein L9
MKVLLKKDVDNLGFAGEVVHVANGYGRNYLLPRDLAVKATPSVLKEAASWRERAASRMAELRKEHRALAERISDTHLVFTARAGETGKLYGSITTNDIVEQLNKELGTELDRRIIIGEPLRQLGEHMVSVRLSRDFQPQVKVIIHPEGDTVVEEPAAEEVEAAAEAVETDEEEMVEVMAGAEEEPAE